MSCSTHVPERGNNYTRNIKFTHVDVGAKTLCRCPQSWMPGKGNDNDSRLSRSRKICSDPSPRLTERGSARATAGTITSVRSKYHAPFSCECGTTHAVASHKATEVGKASQAVNQ